MGLIEKTTFGKRLMHDSRSRIITSAAVGFGLNLAYALYNGVLGVRGHSLWFITLCAYYLMLSTTRFIALVHGRRRTAGRASGIRMMRISGVLLMTLAVVLSGSVYLSLKQDITVRQHQIGMITLAAYTFSKVGWSVVHAVKARKIQAPLLTVIRHIGCADAAASVLSLQRSMLVSFGEMGQAEIRLMNTATGVGACLLVFLLGVSMAVQKNKGERSALHGEIQTGKGK